MPANPKPAARDAPKTADIIRLYYGHAQSLYTQAETALLAKLRQPSHPDHLTFNFVATGTFTDKIASVKELIEVR